MPDADESTSPIPASEQFLSVQTVAGLFEVSDETVREWIAKKYVRAIKIDGIWRINRQSVHDFANARYNA